MAGTSAPLLDAVVFDTDGVLTRTATTHAAAWAAVLDPLLATMADGPAARPLRDADYRRHLDGVGRYDGVAALLGSRGIELPWGSPEDAPGHGSVCAVGNLKNEAFLRVLAEHGVEPYTSTRELIDALREAGIGTAAISASRNCRAVLEAAGLLGRFDAVVDGTDVAALGLRGKPDPAVFLEATARLGVDTTRSAVVEDAESGVRAGRRGGFALVVGLDRTRHPTALAEADLVVPDAADLQVVDRSLVLEPHPRTPIRRLPDVLSDDDVARMLGGRTVQVRLDGQPALAVHPGDDDAGATDTLAVVIGTDEAALETVRRSGLGVVVADDGADAGATSAAHCRLDGAGRIDELMALIEREVRGG